MQATPAAPHASLRPLIASLRHDKFRVALMAAVVALGAVVAAATIHPLYEADSTLVVLLGSEYTYRPVAGENVTVTNALDREQILRTEVKILEIPDLRRKVIREIGIERLYPELLEAPGLLARAKAAVQDAADNLRASAGISVAPKREPDLVESALILLDAHLSVEAVKAGNAIELAFAHRDPEVVAEVLDRLEAAYLERRRDLYRNQEAAIVGEQVSVLRANLEAADTNLTRFKASRGIADYQARRAILLSQQGALEADLKAAKSAVAQETARLEQLADQGRSVPRDVMQSRDADVDQRLAPLRGSIAALRAREAEQSLHYRDGSPLFEDTRQQIAALEADLARQRGDHATGAYRTGQNPLFLQIQQESARAKVELEAAKARMVLGETQLSEVGASLTALNGDEQHLVELERARAVLEENFRAAIKLRNERRVTETVEAERQANVRVVQSAVVPTLPRPTRKLILMAGAVLGLVGAAGMALASHFFRRVYLLPEALEADTGLRVLCSMPPTRRLIHANLAIRPD